MSAVLPGGDGVIVFVWLASARRLVTICAAVKEVGFAVTCTVSRRPAVTWGGGKVSLVNGERKRWRGRKEARKKRPKRRKRVHRDRGSLVNFRNGGCASKGSV